MRNYLLVLLVLSHNVFANPIETSTNEISTAHTTIIPGGEGLLEGNFAETVSTLEFSGPITPGGLDVHLSGTAKSIYEQIIALNPAYDVFDFPESAASLQADGITRENIDQTPGSEVSTTAAVKARNLLKRQDGINCGIRSYAWYPNCAEGYIYLRRLGNASCGAAANTCARVSCSNNCGMWLCAKRSAKTVRCGSIANDVNAISKKCYRTQTGGWIEAGGRKAFSSHNIEFGYANC